MVGRVEKLKGAETTTVSGRFEMQVSDAILERVVGR
jgi:hypothetical protein